MSEHADPTDRLFSLVEREMVEQTKPEQLQGVSKDALQALAKRLRAARDRARRIGRQQKREIRGKTDPKGATPARDNTGTEAKAEALVEALKRVTEALRKLNAPTQAELMRKALAMKRAASAPQHPRFGQDGVERHAVEAEQPPNSKVRPAGGRPCVAGGKSRSGQARPLNASLAWLSLSSVPEFRALCTLSGNAQALVREQNQPDSLRDSSQADIALASAKIAPGLSQLLRPCLVRF